MVVHSGKCGRCNSTVQRDTSTCSSCGATWKPNSRKQALLATFIWLPIICFIVAAVVTRWADESGLINIEYPPPWVMSIFAFFWATSVAVTWTRYARSQRVWRARAVSTRPVSKWGFEIWTRSGVVRDIQVFSETRVSSSSTGGGGYLHQGSGYVSAPSVSVSSSVTTTQRLFVDDGAEDEWICDAPKEFLVRVGHEVKAWFLETKRGGVDCIWVRNEVTGRGWRFGIPDKHLPKWPRIHLWLFPVLAIAGFIYLQGRYLLVRDAFMGQLSPWVAKFATPFLNLTYGPGLNALDVGLVVLTVTWLALAVAYIMRQRAAVSRVLQTLDEMK